MQDSGWVYLLIRNQFGDRQIKRIVVKLFLTVAIEKRSEKSKELCRNKVCISGAELVVLSEAGNRSATLCNTRFSNEAQDNQGKPEVCDLFMHSSLGESMKVCW